MVSRLVARDVRTVTGRNLRHIQDVSQLDPWVTSHTRVKSQQLNNELVTVPNEDKWRLPYLQDLLRQRSLAYYSSSEENFQFIDNLIKSLVI